MLSPFAASNPGAAQPETAMPEIDKPFLDVLEAAALAAGEAIMDIYRAGVRVDVKADLSPVTEADRRAEAVILAALAAHYPDIPVIAEESVSAGTVPDISGGTFFLVDPLDGTREFIAARDEFTVNIALVSGGVPRAGIVYAPARNVGYIAGGGRAERFETDGTATVTARRSIACRPCPRQVVAVGSRSHDTPETARFLAEHGIEDTCPIGSSLKFCLVAEGTADLYPRFGRTMEWDTAAGDAVLRAAGGETRTLDGHPLAYGKRGQAQDADFANPHFIAAGPGWRERAPGS